MEGRTAVCPSTRFLLVQAKISPEKVFDYWIIVAVCGFILIGSLQTGWTMPQTVRSPTFWLLILAGLRAIFSINQAVTIKPSGLGRWQLAFHYWPFGWRRYW